MARCGLPSPTLYHLVWTECHEWEQGYRACGGQTLTLGFPSCNMGIISQHIHPHKLIKQGFGVYG